LRERIESQFVSLQAAAQSKIFARPVWVLPAGRRGDGCGEPQNREGKISPKNPAQLANWKNFLKKG
jgi:hypothetical protein